MSEQLLIYQKSYDLIVHLYPLVNRIPKFHKQVLGREIEHTSVVLLTLILKANNARGPDRHRLQERISEQLDCLRILVRLTKDLKFMSVKQYTTTAERINEIGKMLSGWMKSSQWSMIESKGESH
ncbi:diversity-generating retroelement protein Avd [Patescibacteria group bacterium]|nr:diversity-generating retroelement protein Avd [Patescibacteria group bacterium]